MREFTEDMKNWLLALIAGTLTDESILKGFLKYYVSFNLCIIDVRLEVLYHTSFASAEMSYAEAEIRRVLSDATEICQCEGGMSYADL